MKNENEVTDAMFIMDNGAQLSAKGPRKALADAVVDEETPWLTIETPYNTLVIKKEKLSAAVLGSGSQIQKVGLS